MMLRHLVIGVGNPILGDDGIGIRVAAEVRRGLPECMAERVDVTEACVGGLRLAEMTEGYDHVVIIDSYSPATRPGYIHEWSLDQLARCSPPQHIACAHDTTLSTGLDLCRELGMHTPDDVRVFAIEVDDVSTFSDVLSDDVEAAIPQAAGRVLADLILSDTYSATAQS